MGIKAIRGIKNSAFLPLGTELKELELELNWNNEQVLRKMESNCVLIHTLRSSYCLLLVDVHAYELSH